MNTSIIGKKYNYLTVEKADARNGSGTQLFYCKCKCGGYAITTKHNIVYGHTKSCGCKRVESNSKKVKDMVGKRFGRWLVLEKAGKTKLNDHQYLCRCDCGTERVVKGSSLRAGRSVSCGCYNYEVLKSRRNEIQKNWKGDKVSYSGCHYWVIRLLGRPNKCEHCGKIGKRFHWANKDHKYKRNPEDWIRLCAKCHYKMDRENGDRVRGKNHYKKYSIKTKKCQTKLK